MELLPIYITSSLQVITIINNHAQNPNGIVVELFINSITKLHIYAVYIPIMSIEGKMIRLRRRTLHIS